MSLTRSEAEHVARLARLRLSSEELEHMREQLSDILDYIQRLQEVDIEGAPPMAHVTGLSTVMRADEVRPNLSREEALKNAPAQRDGMFQVKAVFEE